MDSIVRLKNRKTGEDKGITFEHAQNILRIDKYNDFEIADKKKFQFINNELIKRPSPKVSKRAAKPKGDNQGGEVSE